MNPLNYSDEFIWGLRFYFDGRRTSGAAVAVANLVLNDADGRIFILQVE